MGNAPVTMGLKTHKNSYQHGETMTGTVYLSVTSVDAKIQSYQGIQLSFGGQENTEVRIKEENGDRGTTYRTERETASIFHVEIPLTTFSSPLRPANYEFPFEWKLPDTPLPSSFRNRKSHSGHCEVRYTLSAYLMPQDGSRNPMGFLSSNIHSTSSSGTSASQTIQFVGAPTRAIPEPLQLAEERTVVNGLCCCWKQGHISLGWEADTIVLTPQAECKLLLRGSNASAIPVSKLRVQLIQSVHWQAGSDDDFQKRHTRSHNTTLVDYYVDVGHLQQWHGTAEKPQGGYQSVNPSGLAGLRAILDRPVAQRHPAAAHRARIHPDLRGAHLPRQLAGEHQQAEVEQPEQQHGVGNVMLEQADHRGAALVDEGCMRPSP